MKTLPLHGQLLGSELLLATLIATATGCGSGTTNAGLQQSEQGGATGGIGGLQTSSATGGMPAAGGLGSSGGSTTATTSNNSGGSATGGSSATGGASSIIGSSTGGTASQGGTTHSTTGSKATGGSTSTASSGGRPSTGGMGNGGASAGAMNTGGTSAAGAGIGGASAKSTGGANAGGASNGGSSTGTKSTGGASAGGASNGGASAGTKSTGGANDGGSTAAGGSSSGSCNFTVDAQLASAIKSNSPGTIGIVKWSVAGTTPSSAYIEFGLDTTYGTTAPVDLTVTNYQTPLLGMKPTKTYHYRIVASSGSTSCTSQDFTIQTGSKTTSVSISNFKVNNETARKRGFIVTSYWQGTGLAVPFIIDADGDIVWWYAGGPTGGIARARMSVDAKNMWMVVPALGAGGPVQRVTIDTLEPQTYSSTKASHDIAAVSGSLMAFMDYSTTCNGIIEIDPSGTTKKVFDAQGVVPSSGCHGNALRYSKTEDVYTYGDLQSDVYVVSRSGSVQWKLSQKVTGGNSSWGGKQHGHQLLDNSIIIFANSGSSASASAAIEYSLDGQLIKKFTSGGYTGNLGDVQRLPGGNTLITYGNGHNIQEVDSSGNVVLEITGGNSSFGYAEWRESLYGLPMDIAE